MEMQKLKMANYYGNYLHKSIKATTINRASPESKETFKVRP
jgi:hypothetical protein